MSTPITFIAECCQNHNGKPDILKQMVDAAAEAGATHVKIQTIFADDVSFRPEFEEGETRPDGSIKTIKRPYAPEVERLKSLELNYQQQTQFIRWCEAAGVIPMTTAFTVNSIPRIVDAGFKHIKIASYDCGSMPLLEAAVDAFETITVSTGASTDEEIKAAAKLLTSSGKPFSLLHCVTLYPTPLNQMHLNRLQWLKQLAAHVGLSDHSLTGRDGVKAALAAISLGAEVIERHFTILPDDETRDGKVSIRPEHIHEIVAFANLTREQQQAIIREHIPEFETMLGSAMRDLSDEELRNRAYYRGRFCNKINDKQVYNWEPESKQAIERKRYAS